jgi:hypothetical protein
MRERNRPGFRKGGKRAQRESFENTRDLLGGLLGAKNAGVTEVILKLAHLSAVGVHQVLLDVTGLVDLINNDLGVVVGNESLDSEGNSDAQPMNQGLVLGAIVGHLVVDL